MTTATVMFVAAKGSEIVGNKFGTRTLVFHDNEKYAIVLRYPYMGSGYKTCATEEQVIKSVKVIKGAIAAIIDYKGYVYKICKNDDGTEVLKIDRERIVEGETVIL